MKTLTMMTAALLAVVAPCAVADPFEHAVYESVSIDGAWEMAYRPQACGTADCPKFTGVAIRNAVPGYWEDMIADFRAAGMKDGFRPNPWHTEQTFPIRQAMLFEYRVGKGRLLVCSFRFSEGDPASAWLRNALVGYAAGERFDPPQELTAAQLAAVLDAPILSGERDSNRAVNVNDPASLVRANELAQP